MKKFSVFRNHYSKFVVLSLFLLIFLQFSGFGYANAADSQLRAEIGPNNSYVILENSEIYVKYLAYTLQHDEFAIKEFRIKSAGNENQVGSGSYYYLDADSGRGPLYDASIIYNGTNKKTVRLIWNNEFNNPDKKITHDVTIFENSRYLKIDHINDKYGVNVVDLGQPGGTTSGTHVAYGHSGWNRGYITYQEGGEFFGSYYNRYPPDGVNDPVDGGSLNYNGHFIVGVYNSSNGRGFARVLPVYDFSIIKLLLTPTTRRGLEMFPHPFMEEHDPFTVYLYVVTGGESEILSMGKQLAGGGTQGFVDVPSGYWAEEAIYKIYYAGITSGCSQSPLSYCPEDPVTRDQMAVFLGRAKNGSSFTPPNPTGIFDDVPVSYWAAGWIEEFYNDGITGGCGTNPLRYCPEDFVTRDQMAIFLLRAKHGSSYTPPPATGIFDDVPITHWAADWIEELYNEGITSGCSTSNYCPEDTVTRSQMAVFIVRTFGL